MKERYILLINEDKSWSLSEESEMNGIKDDGRDFAIFHIGPKTSGSKIAGIMRELFSEEEVAFMPITGILAGMTLQEAFINFLKTKKRNND